MLNSLANLLKRIGISSNSATIYGLLITTISGFLIIRDKFVLAFIALVIAGFLDILDGKIARIEKKKYMFGALLDSAVDRYAEAILFIAIAIYFIQLDNLICAILTMSALAGSFEISYIHARSQGLGVGSRVGFWGRGERMVFLIIALFLSNLEGAIICLGIFTHFTALRRLFFARSKLIQLSNKKPADANQMNLEESKDKRSSIGYIIITIIAVSFLIISKLIRIF